MTGNHVSIKTKKIIAFGLLSPLVLFGLWHLFNILILMPKLMPYTADDVWFEMESSRRSIISLVHFWFKYALENGRFATGLNHIFFSFSYISESYWWRFIFQSLPILGVYTMASYLFYKLEKNLVSTVSFFILLCLSTYFDNHHHLIGAYPLSYPLALTCSLVYFLENLKELEGSEGNTYVKLATFSFPFLIYEAFYPLQVSVLLLKCMYQKKSGIKIKDITRKTSHELKILLVIFLLYTLFLLFRTQSSLTGLKLSFHFIDILFSWFNYATGFLHFETEVVMVVFLSLLILSVIRIFKSKGKDQYRLIYFLLLWLMPPFMLSITNKYQLWASIGGNTYVTTFISQVGFCLLVSSLLVSSQQRKSIFIIVIGFVFYFSNTGYTAQALGERLKTFQIFEQQVKKEVVKSRLNCLDIKATETLRRIWGLCGANEEICSEKIGHVLGKKGIQFCIKQDK
jgi:hypothetical protein